MGRSAEEALWLAGVPDLTPGTPAELLNLSEWRYSNLPGLGDGVLKFAGGRVVSEEWPRLP